MAARIIGGRAFGPGTLVALLMENHELASAILRWSQQALDPPLTDAELALAALEVFLSLDRAEEEGA